MSADAIVFQMNRAKSLEEALAAQEAAREHLKEHPEDALEIGSAAESLSMLVKSFEPD